MTFARPFLPRSIALRRRDRLRITRLDSVDARTCACVHSISEHWTLNIVQLFNVQCVITSLFNVKCSMFNVQCSMFIYLFSCLSLASINEHWTLNIEHWTVQTWALAHIYPWCKGNFTNAMRKSFVSIHVTHYEHRLELLLKVTLLRTCVDVL